MSEVQAARTGGTRGRGGYRGGRGGFRGGRNPSRSQRADNEQENIPPASLDEQGEVGDLKRKFGDKVPLLREVCPGWSDEDLVFALQETDGDVEAAVDRISSGTVSQWGEVKKKQPKAKDAAASSAEAGAPRGRGRGSFEGRGRGRATERGARAGRGARVASQANGTKPAAKTTEDSVGDTVAAATTTTEPSGAWDTAPTNGDAAAARDWANDPGKDALSSLTTDEPKPASAAAPTNKKAGGWAGLFAKPPPAPKPANTTAPTSQPEEKTSIPAFAEDTSSHQPIQPPPIEALIVDEGPSELPSAPHSDTANDLTPSKDQLTETNLELLPDVSHPPVSATAASTVASTQDPLVPSETTKPPIRPGMSGFAASAMKATGAGGRSASYTRKVMEQQEAVVMPGNHAVEKTAVQFGKMGMNDSDDVDVDEDREEPETRTQLPDDSPAAPRASLPPPPMQEVQASAPIPTQPSTDAPQIQRQAPGLPPVTQQAQQPSPQSASAYTDPYRYGQGQKAYDPFGQQPAAQGQSQAQSSEPFSNQVPNQAHPASAAQNDYSQYYGREGYQNYYGGYGQGHDAQRAASSFGTSSQEVQGQYATARPQQGYGQHDAQGSGQNTPAPTMPGHQAQHSQHAGSQGGHAGYPYGYPGAYNQQYPQYNQTYMNQMSHRYGANRPMFDDVRRQQQAAGQDSEQHYANQYGYGYNQQYGGNYKSNMYGQQPQQYSYEHSASPANAGAFGAREGSYGRTGSTQPSEAPQSAATGTNAFGGVPDPFGRSSSGFGQNQAMAGQHSGHQGSEEVAKASGPSPSTQSGRPGSAVNSAQGQPGTLPPPQSQHSGQQAFGGYPQYGGGLGNFGGHQTAHQNSGYSQYAGNAFGSYGGYGGGGRGWTGGNYGSSH